MKEKEIFDESKLKFDKFIAITGAGCSKASGIPTFEEVDGLKQKLSVEYKAEHPEEFQKAIDALKTSVEGKEPNDAHKALAEYDVPIITMNVDGLHQKAGSKVVYELHGSAAEDNIVLYGEKVHYYEEVYDLLNANVGTPDNHVCLLIVGTSLQTALANELKGYAMLFCNMYIKEITMDAEHKVREFLEKHHA